MANHMCVICVLACVMIIANVCLKVKATSFV